jgi:hypothetical protein
MVMPLCGTFEYSGVVSAATLARAAYWLLDAPADHSPLGRSRTEYDPLRHDRLVGLRPILQISGGRFALIASSRSHARVSSASFDVDHDLPGRFHVGDVLTLIRTGTADLALSLMRDGRLMCAIGAVTVLRLGSAITVRGQSQVERTRSWDRKDEWIEVAVGEERKRLQKREEATFGSYRVTVVRCYEPGIPGEYESVAVSLDEADLHTAAVRSAELLAQPGGGLVLEQW